MSSFGWIATFSYLAVGCVNFVISFLFYRRYRDTKHVVPLLGCIGPTIFGIGVLFLSSIFFPLWATAIVPFLCTLWPSAISLLLFDAGNLMLTFHFVLKARILNRDLRFTLPGGLSIFQGLSLLVAIGFTSSNWVALGMTPIVSTAFGCQAVFPSWLYIRNIFRIMAINLIHALLFCIPLYTHVRRMDKSTHSDTKRSFTASMMTTKSDNKLIGLIRRVVYATTLSWLCSTFLYIFIWTGVSGIWTNLVAIIESTVNWGFAIWALPIPQDRQQQADELGTSSTPLSTSKV